MWYITRHHFNQGYDMNVQEAWALGYSGKGVVVTIMDDGVDHNHSDIKQNYDPLASYDFNDNDNDPMPNWRRSSDNKHGTRCAGQVAAIGNNSVCMVGVAFNARIGGIRMLDGYITDRLEADTLHFRNDHIHVYSSSWGPEDTGRLYEGPGVLTQSAFQKGITSGRNNFGNVYIWASGNGGMHYDSCACDGYASSPFTLSVSGVGEGNKRPWYLEQCSSTLVTTYSSGGPGERMISTIDPNEKCTSSHTGTSASAPMAAGIVALLLEANPRLSWRDVQYVTLLAANPAPFVDGNFTKNAVGRSYSMLYGYGLMDAGKMVRLGELWRGLPPHHQCTSRVMNYKTRLEGKFNISFPLVFYGCDTVPREDNETYSNYTEKSSEEGSPIVYLEHVQLYADIVYQRRGLLQITLISPSGTETVLLPPRQQDDFSGSIGLLTWPLTTVQLWGESAKGTWHVRLDNIAGLKSRKANTVESFTGYWRSAWIVAYGTDKYPIRLRPPKPDRLPPSDWFEAFSKYVVDDSDWKEVYTCHVECAPGGCTGPGADQCLGGCRHYATQSRQCVPECPRGTTPYGALRISLPRGHNDIPRTRIRPGRIRSSKSFASNIVCQPCWTLCGACVRPHTEYDCMACSHGRYLVPLLTPDDSQHLDPDVTILPEWDSDGVSKKTLPSLIGTCRTECPMGYYANKSSSTCNRCLPHCVQCTGPRSGECNLCEPGYRLVHGRCVDGNSVDGRCAAGQFLKQSQCEKCADGCDPTGCLPHGGCSICKPGYRYLWNSSCVKSCPDGWYVGDELPEPFVMSPSTSVESKTALRRCEPCSPGCLTCTTFGACSQCMEGLKLSKGRCVSTSSSSSCHPQCDTCFRNSFDCLTCSTGRVFLPSVLLEQRKSQLLSNAPPSFNQRDSAEVAKPPFSPNSYLCPKTCPPGTFAKLTPEGSVCRSCPPSCSLCDSEKHCLQCWPDFYLLEDSGQCQVRPSCRQSEYYNVTEQSCLPCADGCSTCSGGLPTQCTSCSTQPPTPHCLHLPENGQSNSIAGSFDAPVGQCLPCCPYRIALLNASPKHCMFCVADRVTCMSGTEINAGEGLLFEELSPSPPSVSSWLTREPSRLLLFVLCGIFILGVIIFLTIHGLCAWRRYKQRRSEPSTMAVRQRRRRGLNSLPTSDEDDGAKVALKLSKEREDVTMNGNGHLPTVGTSNGTTSPSTIVYEAPVLTPQRSPPQSDKHRQVFYSPLGPAESVILPGPNRVPHDTCTTHLPDEYCSRSVPLPTKQKHTVPATTTASTTPSSNPPREIFPF